MSKKVPATYETKVNAALAYLNRNVSIDAMQDLYGVSSRCLTDPEVLKGVAERKGSSVDEINRCIEMTRKENFHRAREMKRREY